MTEELNADLTKPAVLQTRDMAWQASPSATVWRKRLELIGQAESGRVTSIVKYDPGSSFHKHLHPDGEEILVLEGVFSDEHGRYPAGSYLLNPEGFSHAPFSEEGCVLFVKLRQYPGEERPHIAVDTKTGTWEEVSPGFERLWLLRDDAYPEKIRLTRIEAGADIPAHDHLGGEEVFVLEGALEDENGRYETGTWFRFPDGSYHEPFTKDGCLLYVKTGHL